jgi:hypothetical protein
MFLHVDPVSEHDGRAPSVKEVQPRPEGIIHPLHIYSLVNARSIRPLLSLNGRVTSTWSPGT